MKKDGFPFLPLMAVMHIFCAWKVLAFSIHSFSVVGMVDMGKVHGGDLLVDSKGEMIDEGGFIQDSGFGGEVLEVGDEFLETIVEGPIFLLEGLLNEFSKVRASGSFDIKGIEGGFEVFSKFIKDLFFGINSGIEYLVVPHFREVNASTLTHLVQGSHDLKLVGGIKFGINGEVGPQGLDPVYGVCRIIREVSGGGCFKFGVDDNIRVGGLGGAEAEGTGLLGVDCLLMPKGWMGTVSVNDVGMRLGSRGWLSSSLESGWAEKPLWVLQWEMSNGVMSCSWIGGTDGHS